MLAAKCREELRGEKRHSGDQERGLFKRAKRPSWKSGIVYQIYPRSFCDSNGDGIGDLGGISSKADYFVELGVDFIWISPIFKSPMKDFGYDISDFREIDPIFGTMEDFDHLLKEMHSRDIKVVLDFVPNHSSDQHEWFQKSLKNITKYQDYYVWKDPAGYDKDGKPIPPNNWLSVFRYSAWEWSEERNQFYLHQFLKEQPDLNYRNPEVVVEMNNVLRFWLDRGVDGFRIDAVKFLFEVADVYGADEPNDPESGVTDSSQYEFLQHIYTVNQPETFAIIRGWRKIMDEYPDKIMMVEVYDDDIEQVMNYYGTYTDPLSDFPFNFLLITSFRDRSQLSGVSLKAIVDRWMKNLPQWKWPNWVLGNHDVKRVASRLGPDIVDALNMLILLLPGTPVTYNGEEIGMENRVLSYEETKDPWGLNNGPEHYSERSRDPERTPMQWDDSKFSGFTKGKSTWIPVHENYRRINVHVQNSVSESHLKVYKKAAELRKEDAFQFGQLDFHLVTEEIVAFVRSYNGDSRYVVVINTSTQEEITDLSSGSIRLPETGVVIIRSSSDNRPETKAGSILNLNQLSLIGGEGMVLELIE